MRVSYSYIYDNIILLFSLAKEPTLALLTFTNGFRLMEKAALTWPIIAANLCLDNIEIIRANRYSSEAEKASQVFTEWLNNAPRLNGGKYGKTC